ncbi:MULTISPECIES: hypothetical protein [Thiomonas]|jgi:hypothetical protein|uniref:hypothetical protein n=1 Tax=Thiomonas TaxID=32012 RepID=UPI0004DBC253|nr:MULTISPECIES: hypothetical protein [Thiomonas]CQR44152.1 conserved exported hypothetical protein [Thiomonas sp. CB3]MBN8777797.1 hypothetical protein [Thiomonas arsenitoxydans]MDD5000392.1 hypothetical protein [Thiomonas arsenitoxydans]CDW94333.1 conserved exported hypothetical protein [Thiomonas sp. CB2]VDY06143.1 conserved exported protein of unknown function [Thiomonas sp. Bio17B3]
MPQNLTLSTLSTMMLTLPAAHSAWTQPNFGAVLLAELQQTGALIDPLQQGIRRGSHALTDDVSLMVLQRSEGDDDLRVKAGLSYFSIIPGCACEADPTPMSELPEYVELRVAIRRTDSAATLELLDD